MDFKEWGDVNWVYLAHDRGQCSALVKKIMHLRIS
jgi:hypothetical protein